MHFISELINYILLFIALYFEVFLLITYFETRKIEKGFELMPLPEKLPSVTIFVPCWNEEGTICKTIFSLLKLDYPKHLLSIFIIDDGSTDNTLKVVQRFARNKQIKIWSKENGGKHTALNYGLALATSDLVGCLDADSFVHPLALKKIVAKFMDKEMMAVTPSIRVHEPRNIIELIQKSEYILGVFMRKVFARLNALYITPGPFTIFRKSVFELVGNYKHAYNTEDMEIAMRMQKNGLKIGNVHDAFIYTVAPKNLRVLLKQRLRWSYGFIKNAIDYKQMFFSPQYGHLGIMILPIAGFSLFTSIYFALQRISSWILSGWARFVEWNTVGLHWPNFNFDFFYFNTSIIGLISIVAVVGVISIIIMSRHLTQEKHKIGFDSIYFLFLYSFIAPIWISKALYRAAFAKKTSWR